MNAETEEKIQNAVDTIKGVDVPIGDLKADLAQPNTIKEDAPAGEAAIAKASASAQPPRPVKILDVLENTLGTMTGWTSESMLAISHLLYVRTKERYRASLVMPVPAPPEPLLPETATGNADANV